MAVQLTRDPDRAHCQRVVPRRGEGEGTMTPVQHAWSTLLIAASTLLVASCSDDVTFIPASGAADAANMEDAVVGDAGVTDTATAADVAAADVTVGLPS